MVVIVVYCTRHGTLNLFDAAIILITVNTILVSIICLGD